MNLYSIEVKVCATAYIKAPNAAAAAKIARKLKLDSLEVSDAGGEVAINGDDFRSPTLPDVSLSPAMTIQGVWPKCTASLAEEDIT